MKEINIDPATAAAASLFYDKLTTPDSEDWIVIADGNQVHVAAFQETRHGDRKAVHICYGCAPTTEFKSLVRRLPAGHKLGCVSVMILRDSEERGATKLFVFLRRQAREKNFSLTTMHGPASTAEAVRSMASGHAAQWGAAHQ